MICQLHIRCLQHLSNESSQKVELFFDFFSRHLQVFDSPVHSDAFIKTIVGFDFNCKWYHHQTTIASVPPIAILTASSSLNDRARIETILCFPKKSDDSGFLYNRFAPILALSVSLCLSLSLSFCHLWVFGFWKSMIINMVSSPT